MLEFVPVILKNAFSKPATRQAVREPFKGQKGHICIDISSCIFCGLCSRKCPPKAITVVRAEKKWSINNFRCIMCNSCVESCPKKCLSMDNHYIHPAASKSVEEFVAPAKAPDEEKVHA